MPILDAEYIKEQAHKPCFWSEDYGFDVVAFTHAMEQIYSNRVGSKINSLKKEIEQLTARVHELEEENARLKAESRDASLGLNDYYGRKLAAEQLNNKLLRAALNQWIDIAANCSIESGCCCCGESIENHSHPMACGHSPVDMADSVVRGAIDSTDKALSLPASTEALDKYVAEKVKEAMK